MVEIPLPIYPKREVLFIIVRVILFTVMMCRQFKCRDKTTVMKKAKKKIQLHKETVSVLTRKKMETIGGNQTMITRNVPTYCVSYPQICNDYPPV